MKVEDMDLKPSGKTPAAQRTPRSAKKDEGVKEDPFDFQSNANKHPEPMANIGSTQVHVQKKSPGQLQYTVTPKAGRFVCSANHRMFICKFQLQVRAHRAHRVRASWRGLGLSAHSSGNGCSTHCQVDGVFSPRGR